MSVNFKQHYTDCEILAPAGSYQCMIAAFNAGADAVYVGGSMFGARAYADNFDTEELISAIDYAHLRGKRLYLTVNTLLKEQELENSLSDYIKPLYEAGLDAVIVQDMGVLRHIKKEFPDLCIHASTQMTVTGIHFAKELKELGVSRIVTARELSYDEIRHIYEETGLEIESFVHGALCYSYSGQCLLSSLIGGRSGNRGRCAQPCRLPYELYDKNGRNLNSTEKYILSPKDICTLEILPDILKAGVYSLKIEGRMKKPEYVASVVSAYRKYIDILKSGSAYDVDKEDIEILKDIYNRGGFSDGYYGRQNGREMMSLYKPNHYGLRVADILSVTPKNITIKAIKDINEQDVLELNFNKPKKENCILKHGFIKAGATAVIKNNIQGFNNISLLYDDGVFRTRNNKLIADIEKNIIKKSERIPVYGVCHIKAGKKMAMSAYMFLHDNVNGDKKIEACVYGEIPQTASNKPASISDIELKLKKTGATEFYFEKLHIELDDGLFVPVAAINELRRKCLDELKRSVMNIFRRKPENQKIEKIEEQEKFKIILKNKQKTNTSLQIKKPDFADRKIVIECIVSDNIQLEAAVDKEYIDIIGLELSRFSYKEMQENIRIIKAKNKNVYIALPYICREKAIVDFEKNIVFFEDTINEIDGFIARNYEEYVYFSKLLKEKVIKKHFIFDTNIYMFNNKSLEYAEELSSKYENRITPTVPYELNQREIYSVLNEMHNGCEIKDTEENKTKENEKEENKTKENETSEYNQNIIPDIRMEIYGDIPVMTTAGCIKKTTNKCDGKNDSEYRIKDRMNNYMQVMVNCRYCYNSIYNSVPLYLGDDLSALYNMKINHFSIRFTMENEIETKDILDRIENSLKGKANNTLKTDFTRGHFKRGVM